MSALAHAIEERGVPTVAIGLIRLHLEKIRPPRALFVPFELGRPLGEPEDAVFQRQVLETALGLFDRTDGPVVLEDFPTEAPGRLDAPDWRPPLSRTEAGSASATDFAQELEAIGEAWRANRRRRGRTTVGLLAGGPATWPRFLAAWAAGAIPDSPAPPMPAILALRFIADDIRAYYGEAAVADGARPSSRQIDAWFWRRTAAGTLIETIRRVVLAGVDRSMHGVAANLLVPAAYRTNDP